MTKTISLINNYNNLLHIEATDCFFCAAMNQAGVGKTVELTGDFVLFYKRRKCKKLFVI